MHRRPSLLLASLLVAACGDTPDPNDPWSDDPPVQGAVIGELVDGAFVPWEAGAQAAWVWGGQGGAMITPVVAVPLELAGDERLAHITLRNLPDPGFPGSSGELVQFASSEFEEALTEVDGQLLTPTLPDQVGWSDPGGVRLRLEATVRGEAFSTTTTVPIEVANDGADNSCSELPTEGQGCVYTLLPGTLWIAMITPSETPSACPDPQTVEFEYWPDDDAMGHCSGDTWGTLTMPDGRELPGGCLEGLGVQSEAYFPVVQKTLIAGTCTPLIYEFGFDFSACEALCAGG